MASSHSFINLLFRSIIIIIYGDDRCSAESKVMTYYKSEEDMLWTWFEHLIYQLIVIRMIGYFALYIQANSEQFHVKKLFGKNKRFTFNFLLKKSSEEEINLDGKIKDDEIKDKNKIVTNLNHNENFVMELNEESIPKSLAIAWNNLSFSRKSLFINEKLILKNLSGTINFGTITALMGPSGAGKTTLLRCINGMKRSGLSKDTEFYVNKEKNIKSVFIVQQHKHHLLINITVRESLMYSSLLKNNNFISQQNNKSNGETKSLEQLERIVMEKAQFNHRLNVDKILSELMLTNCAENFVSQCSGEEQKRLAIGLELTPRIKPNLICIDEPTTGLDSYTAEQVINLTN